MLERAISSGALHSSGDADSFSSGDAKRWWHQALFVLKNVSAEDQSHEAWPAKPYLNGMTEGCVVDTVKENAQIMVEWQKQREQGSQDVLSKAIGSTVSDEKVGPLQPGLQRGRQSCAVCSKAASDVKLLSCSKCREVRD